MRLDWLRLKLNLKPKLQYQTLKQMMIFPPQEKPTQLWLGLLLVQL